MDFIFIFFFGNKIVKEKSEIIALIIKYSIYNKKTPEKEFYIILFFD